MKKTTKIISLCLSCILAVGAMAGCAGGGQKGENVSLKLSYWPNRELEPEKYALYETYIEEFKKIRPDVTIIPDEGAYGSDEFMVMAATKQLPTVFRKMLTEPQQIIKAGYAKDITSQIKKHGYDTTINSDVMDVVISDGKYYGVPWEGYMVGMWYNMNLFKEAGLVNEDGTPILPTTYDEMVETAKIIKDKTGKAGYAMPTTTGEGGWLFMNLAWSYGVNFMEQENGKWVAKFNSPEGVAALQFVKDLKWKHNVLPENILLGTNEVQQMFATDQVAMSIIPEDRPAKTIKKYEMDKNVIAVGPVMEGPGGRYAQMGGDVWMISPEATDAEVDAAFDWFKLIGQSPEFDDVAKKNFEDKLVADKEAGNIVAFPSFNIWENGTRAEEQMALYQKHVNVEEKLWPKNGMYSDEVTLKPEEPMCAQGLYTILSDAIQAVLSDENADPAQVIADAADKFQTEYLDKAE